jgi:crotonobetainyl-CoA:carnitine CoA-transferase CaiB-like acyl-CoA transferase
MFNRNKKSIAIDLLACRRRDRAQSRQADVVIENRLDDGQVRPNYAAGEGESARHLCQSQGLRRAYVNRTALDEVVQMMGGLAYDGAPATAARGRRQRHHAGSSARSARSTR